MIRTVYMQQFEKDDWLPLAPRHKDIALSVIKTADDLAKVIDGCEVMIANNRVCNEPIGRLMLERGSNIRLIQFSTAGIERGIRFGLPPGVPVCNVPGVKGPTVAEHAMLLLLASFRRTERLLIAFDAQKPRHLGANRDVSQLRERGVL